MKVPPPCGVQDYTVDENGNHPTCTLPYGHGDHEELRGNQIWAQWRGGMPPASADRTAKLEAIVRALAACKPPECQPNNWETFIECVHCEASTDDWRDSQITHEPSCPWRLARELIGDSE